MIFETTDQTGRVIPVRIAEIKDDVVTVDLNHPLAGKTLNFDLEVVDHKQATDEDRKKFMPPQAAQPQQEEPKQEQPKTEEKPEEDNNEEEGCDGNCANCNNH